jgi:hypothetical protein
LFDTLLPANCAKNGAVEKEFMQLYGNDSQFLHANNVIPHDTSGMNALAQYRLLNGRENIPVQLIHLLTHSNVIILRSQCFSKHLRPINYCQHVAHINSNR